MSKAISKSKLIKAINDFPENVNVEELLDRIMFLQKVEIGLEQSESGQVYTTEEVKGKLKKWLK